MHTHKDTHVAWAKKAPRNLGGEVRMLSKRESVPLSAVIREKRKVPTMKDKEISNDFPKRLAMPTPSSSIQIQVRERRTSSSPDTDGRAQCDLPPVESSVTCQCRKNARPCRFGGPYSCGRSACTDGGEVQA